MDCTTPSSALASFESSFKSMVALSPPIQEALEQLHHANVASALNLLLAQRSEPNVGWQPLALALVYLPTLERPSEQQITDHWMPIMSECLAHSEPRVRSLVAHWVEAWATSPTLTKTLLPELKNNVQLYLKNRSTETDNSADAWDDTSGWKTLETSIMAYSAWIKGCNTNVNPEVAEVRKEMLDLIALECVIHVNRHVRAAAFETLTVMLQASATPLNEQAQPKLVEYVVKALETGLEDNWSQVRYAASVTNRHFLLHVANPERFYAILIPRMCLNRYYLAEGVKLYSQETWKLILKDTGRKVVAEFATYVAEYYIKVADFDNHVVRESACHCIAELATKVDSDSVRAHVPKLLNALLMCFNDDSWPVRDAACVASGLFVVGFPEESRPSLEKLYDLWIAHLSDNVWSVREDAAIALGNVIRAYGEEAMKRLTAIADEYIMKATEQAPMTQEEYKVHLEDAKTHEGNQVYSCGSLAPKLRKGGCSDCRFHRPKELWEYSDGTVYLIREFCAVGQSDVAVKYLPQLAELAMLRHFPQTANLQETLWKQIPIICKLLGKKVFKRYLELFLDPLVFTVQSHNRLAKHAAQECVERLSIEIGPSIFRGRLEANPMWFDALSQFAA